MRPLGSAAAGGRGGVGKQGTARLRREKESGGGRKRRQRGAWAAGEEEGGVGRWCSPMGGFC